MKTARVAAAHPGVSRESYRADLPAATHRSSPEAAEHAAAGFSGAPGPTTLAQRHREERASAPACAKCCFGLVAAGIKFAIGTLLKATAGKAPQLCRVDRSPLAPYPAAAPWRETADAGAPVDA